MLRRRLSRFACFAFITFLTFLAFTSAWARAANDAVLERIRKDIDFLASDTCEGRGISTKGIEKAADYIAHEFKAAGLKPAGADGSYFQPFSISGAGRLDQPNQLRLHGPQGQDIDLKLGEDYQVLGLSGTRKVTAPVFFAGYGITAPGAAYDDYGHLNVAGKVVIVLRKTPRFENQRLPFDGDLAMHHAALVTKIVNADLHQAAAVLFVNDRSSSPKGDPLMPFSYTAQATSPAKVAAVHVRRAVIDGMVRSCLGTKLDEIEKAIDGELTPRSAALEGWTATVQVTVKRKLIPAKNIVGILEGSGPLARQTIVVGAHYDHLGYGGPGSLAKNRSAKQIHHGADDNASGTTALMELARRLANNRTTPRRRIVFIAFSGEETGLLGSDYYCNHPLIPLAETAAMVNLDMVGRLRPAKGSKLDHLEVYGTGTAKEFSELIETLNKKQHFQLSKIAGGMGPSDHASFYSKKIPVIFFCTGSHVDYHKPTDTADKINLPGMLRVTDLVQETVSHLATVEKRPEYVYVRSSGMGGRGPSGPKLRFMPAYSEDGKEGVLIEAVVDNGPAHKAGLREGDRIVELAGKPVKNLQAFMVLMRSQKKGQPVEIGFLRNGKKMTVKAIPE
jgi:hypothetical protein